MFRGYLKHHKGGNMYKEDNKEVIKIINEIRKDLKELRLIVKEMFEKDEKETR